MKQIAALFLCFVLVFSAGCAALPPTQSTPVTTVPTPSSIPTAPTSATEPVEEPPFPQPVWDRNCSGFRMDSVLADAIRSNLELPEDTVLTKELLAEVRDLSIFQQPLVSLEGAQYLINLRQFDVCETYLRDMTPLTTLSGLEYLSLSWGYISVIPDLSAMENLRSLSLVVQKLTDMSPAVTAPNLQWLNLADNEIRSIAPAAKIENLTALNLSGNCILDFASVRDNNRVRDALDYLDTDLDLALQAEETAKRIVSQVLTPGMTELEKEFALFNYIIDHMEYEIVYGLAKPYGYNGLVDGHGVCGHYAEAFSLLCNHAGLDVTIVTSDTHAWNMIRLDGQYYHVDTLWDEGWDAFPQYFNRGTDFITEQPDHNCDPLRYPQAADMPQSQYAYLLNK